MVEILKQAQYEPLPVEKQVAIIFAGTQGLLDDLPVDALHEFETFFYDWLDRTDTMVLKEIRDRRTLTDPLRRALTDAVHAARTEFLTRGVAGADRDRDGEHGGEA
jgi:F-type H+-transporting ATPase subunit alpha